MKKINFIILLTIFLSAQFALIQSETEETEDLNKTEYTDNQSKAEYTDDQSETEDDQSKADSSNYSDPTGTWDYGLPVPSMYKTFAEEEVTI